MSIVLAASNMAAHSLAEAREILKNLALSRLENLAFHSAIFSGTEREARLSCSLRKAYPGGIALIISNIRLKSFIDN